MAEEKKGHVKVTVEVEISLSLMEIIKESIESMPNAMQVMSESWKKKKE